MLTIEANGIPFSSGSLLISLFLLILNLEEPCLLLLL